MRKANWIAFAAAIAMMAGTAGWLKVLRERKALGPAGVRVGHFSVYDTRTNLVSTESVIMPADIPGMLSQTLPIDAVEVDSLPKDTTYGLRYYRAPGTDFGVQVSVILMGTDHTSIHQPQYCLYAQDWTITRDERVKIHMTRPFPYDIPVVRLTSSHRIRQTGQVIESLYVYWFVSGDKITAEEGSRLRSMWKTILLKGVMERWAYISYFAPCLPGQEQATFERLEKFIQASVPEFQSVTGQPSGPLSPASARAR